VTTDDLTQLSAFLTAVSSELGSPEVMGVTQAHLITYPLALGRVTPSQDMHGVGVTSALKSGALIKIPNYVVVADSVPAVAGGLATAKLTGERYLQLTRTLNNAYVTAQIDRLAHAGKSTYTETSTLIGKNVAFLKAHEREFHALVGLGLDVTHVRLTPAANAANASEKGCYSGMDLALALQNGCVQGTFTPKTP
jgi:hypothetical protein